MTCGAQFMGGPVHGKTYAFPGDEPPEVMMFDVFDHGQFSKFEYRREVSDLDDGPLWVYVPRDSLQSPS